MLRVTGIALPLTYTEEELCRRTAAALGVLLPCFNTVTALVPLFFPRLAVAFRPLVGRKTGNTP